MSLNIYGLSEGVFKACQFLGLKFPTEAINKPNPVPSDYFGDDFELDSVAKNKLRAERNWTEEIFEKRYQYFANIFSNQKPLKQTKTDLNVFFCDHVLFSAKQGASIADYFDFEFYNKPFSLRRTFRVNKSSIQTQVICNDFMARRLLNDKAKTNRLFAGFLHRDWLDTRTCTFEDFKIFVEKHPRFFSKPVIGSFGKGAEIISTDSDDELDKVFENLKSRHRLLEEIVKQHEDTASFCPDTVNTIRVYTILDTHNVVHILVTNGRLGRVGGVVDNVHVGGGCFVTMDTKTGIIISDGLTRDHERLPKHPDTGKTFKGFRYPCWDKVRAVVKKMAKMIPSVRHIAWDIAVTDKNEAILIEANGNFPALDIQQAPDDVGRQYLYEPFLEEIKKYNEDQMRLLGWRVNNLRDFDDAYDTPLRDDSRLKFAMSKLIPDCASLIDLGCRKNKAAKKFCPVKYYPVDYEKHDDEIIACNFNSGEFPKINADACLCAMTAEYVEHLPRFLADMCSAAQKQILMLCRPIDRERFDVYRWKNPFLTDFTEEFLIKTMEQNGFQLNEQYPTDNASIILYDFRKTPLAKSM